MANPIPVPSVPIGAIYDAQGRKIGDIRIDTNWYEYFKSRETLSSLPDVKLGGLVNGQVLIWNAADSKWENGAN